MRKRQIQRKEEEKEGCAVFGLVFRENVGMRQYIPGYTARLIRTHTALVEYLVVLMVQLRRQAQLFWGHGPWRHAIVDDGRDAVLG